MAIKKNMEIAIKKHGSYCYYCGFRDEDVILREYELLLVSSWCCIFLFLLLPLHFVQWKHSFGVFLPPSLSIALFFFLPHPSLSLFFSPSHSLHFFFSLTVSPSLSLGNTPTQTVISALTLWLSLLVSQCLWSVSEGEDQTALSGNLNSKLSVSFFITHSLCVPPPPFSLPVFLSYFVHLCLPLCPQSFHPSLSVFIITLLPATAN